MNKKLSLLFGYVSLVIAIQLIEIKNLLANPDYIISDFNLVYILAMIGGFLFHFFGDSPSSTDTLTEEIEK